MVLQRMGGGGQSPGYHIHGGSEAGFFVLSVYYHLKYITIVMKQKQEFYLYVAV